MKIRANQIFQTAANNRRSISTEQKYSLLRYNEPKMRGTKTLFDLHQNHTPQPKPAKPKNIATIYCSSLFFMNNQVMAFSLLSKTFTGKGRGTTL